MAELTLAKLASAAVSAGWLFFAARRLSVDEFGELSLALALVVVGVQCADAGLQIRLSVEVAASPEALRPLARRAMLIRLRWASVVACAMVAAHALATAGSVAVPLTMSLSLIATSVYSAPLAALRAVGRVRLEAASEVVARSGVALTAAFLISRGHGVVSVAAVYAAADLLVLGLVIWRFCSERGAGSQDVLAWRFRRPLAVSTTLSTVYWRLDIWLLALLGSPRDLALYGACYRLLDAALLPSQTISALFTGRAASAGRRLPQEFVLWSLAAAGTALPFAVAGAAVGGPLLRLLFGPAFESGAPILAVLAVAAVPSGAMYVGSQAAAVVGPRAFFRTMTVATLASALACAAVVPMYGARGVAWLTLVFQVLLVAKYSQLVWRGSTPHGQLSPAERGV